MVTATQPRKGRKQPAQKHNGKARPKPQGRSKSKPRAGDDDEAPERSSPAMAEVDAEVLEFIEAIDRFKRMHARPFPSWSEVLQVVRGLGYRRP